MGAYAVVARWAARRLSGGPSLGALLHDVGKPATFRIAPDRIRFDGHVEVGVRIAEEICRRLRFANHETEQILSLIANHMRFADAPRMKESTLKRFFRLPQFDQHLALHRLDCLASHGSLDLYDFVRQRFETLPQDQVRPQLLLSGKDLIEAGYRPGPQFTQMLALAEDAQLEGTIQTRDQALALSGNAGRLPEQTFRPLANSAMRSTLQPLANSSGSAPHPCHPERSRGTCGAPFPNATATVCRRPRPR